MSPRRAARESGFTLLETLVALVIVALVFAAAYGVLGSGGRAAKRADAALSALTRAEAAMARVGVEIPLEIGETVLRDGAWRTTITITADQPAASATWRRLGRRPLRVRVSVARGAAEAPPSATLETLRLGDV